MRINLSTISVLCIVLTREIVLSRSTISERGKVHSTIFTALPTTTFERVTKPFQRSLPVIEDSSTTESGTPMHEELRLVTLKALEEETTTPFEGSPSIDNSPGESDPDVVSLDDQKPERQNSWVQRVPYVVKPPESERRKSSTKLDNLSAEIESHASLQEEDFGNLRWASQVITKSMWKFYPRSKTNSACTYQGELYRQHFKNMTQWAVKMFDSSDITPNGILETDHLNAGHFDECLTLDVRSLSIKGQYCLVSAEYSPHKDLSPEFWVPDEKTNYNQPDPLKTVWLDAKPHTDPARKNRSQFEFAVCLPKACTAEDLQISLQETVNHVAVSHKLNFKLSVRPVDCSVKDPPIRDPVGFTLTLLVFLSAAGLLFIGTCLDILVYRKSKSKSFLRTCLKPFSASKNLERLQKPGEDLDFAPVNYLKVQILIQIINGHRIMFLFGNRIYNPSWIERLARHPLSAYVNGGSSVIVDIFFVISGFLAYIFIYRTLQRKKNINLTMVFFYRWLRIVPLYALVMAFYTFIMPNLGDGPLWNRFVEKEVTPCRTNWWLNLLFINNYVNADKLCMIHSWYLSVDMQLFILTAIIAVFIFRHERHAKAIFTSLITIAVVVPAVHLYIEEHSSVTYAFQKFLKDINSDPSFYDMYIRTHTRAIPYILGLTTAHIYLKLKERKFKFTVRQLWTGVGICFLLGNTAVFYSAFFYLPDRPFYLIEHVLYNPLHRVMFAFIPCFILLGQGTTGFGIVSRFMSSPFFGVLGRLTYCGYLIHPIIQLTMIYSERTASFITPLKFAWGTCGDVLATFLLALALNLLFESPMDRLQKKIFQSFIRQYREPKKPLEQTEPGDMVEKSEGSLPEDGQPQNEQLDHTGETRLSGSQDLSAT